MLIMSKLVLKMTTITRRNRILTALNDGIPDRPPIAFDAHGDTMSAVYKHYGAVSKNDLYLKTGIDGFSVWEWNAVMGRYTGTLKISSDGTELDFWGNSSQHNFGLLECNTVEDLNTHAWPQVDDFDFSHIHAQALEIKAQDMVVSAGHIGLGYQIHNMLRGNENALYDVTDEKYMQVYVDKMTEFTTGYIENLLNAGQGEIEVVRADDDIGTMDRLMISPEMWRTYYKPAWKQAFDIVHAHGAKVWFHSCGYIWPLLEDLIEIGVDCWNPFPDYVKDNDHARLKEFRKGRLALDGGVSHLTLVHKKPADVRDATRRVLDTFGPDGGLLIGPSQVFTEDMPTENIITFFDTVLEG
jgi:uroporphyrinogen decarboxylase